MALKNPINIRLSTEQLIRYETESAKLGIPLATYLRKQLEVRENFMEEISYLKRAVTSALESIEKSKGESSQDKEISIMLEMLLLLRQTAQPQKVQIAQSELKRLGFNVWSSEGEE